MRFADPALLSVLTQWRNGGDHAERASADNLWFEERVGPTRQALFESEAAGAADPIALQNRQTDYFETFVKIDFDAEVDANLWPHTFLSEFEPADLGPGPLEPFQPIVRLEDLTRPLEAWGMPGENLRQRFDRLKAAFDDPAQADVFARFLESWNRKRDRRPAFAAWKDQLLHELEQPDWPDLLRDRLGLAHYDCRNGPMPVALVEYQVRDVTIEAAAHGLSHSFTAPTVLDSGPWPYFFPAPRELPYGRVMPLNPVDDESQLLAEMLHVRLTYRREHIVRLGEILRPLGTPDIKELRNRHLFALQVAALRDDFGEDIP
ncbi:MAG TPA: hypothetical protein VGG99_06335 [Acetobacteraceae bacterium]|jgi:hypothetical protein